MKKMKLYDEGNTGIAISSGFVETHAGNLHVYADRTQAGNIVFITTDNFKKYIPIEWTKRWAMKSENTYNREQIVEMLNDWEKENE